MRYAVLFLHFVVFAASAQSSRALLTKEAERMQSFVVARDSVGVSTFFDFPILDEHAQWFVEHEPTETKTEKDYFLRNYPQVFSDDVTRLFAVFDLWQLDNVDSLELQLPTSDLCYTRYEVKTKGNEIQFILIVNGRESQIRDERGDDMTDDYVCQEYAEQWTFELVNGKLKFKKYVLAG